MHRPVCLGDTVYLGHFLGWHFEGTIMADARGAAVGSQEDQVDPDPAPSVALGAAGQAGNVAENTISTSASSSKRSSSEQE